MDIVLIVLDFFLGISYLGSGIAAHFDWFDIALGIAWSMIGGVNIYIHRKQKKRKAENIARYDQMCKDLNELRERQNRLQ